MIEFNRPTSDATPSCLDLHPCLPGPALHSRGSAARKVGSALRQLIEQVLGLLQIARVKPLGEPAVDWREKRAGLIDWIGGGSQTHRLRCRFYEGKSAFRILKLA